MKFVSVVTTLVILSSFSVAKEKPKIISIKGQVYYHQTGTWSENIFDKNFHIFNAVIGGGSLKGPTHQTLFTIETDASATTQLRVRIDHSVNKKSKLARESMIEIQNRSPKTYVPVLLDGTSFGIYKVTAQVEDLLSRPLSEPLTAIVDFAGGE